MKKKWSIFTYNKKGGLLLALLKGTLVIVIVSFLILFFLLLAASNNNKPSSIKNIEDLSTEFQPKIGEQDAPVSIVEFGDFLCPSCQSWNEKIYPKLENYIEDGVVNLSYINVLFHGEASKLTSLGAESVFKNDEDSYWDFHKMLFKEVQNTGTDINMEDILNIAEKTTNIDRSKLENDITQEVYSEELERDKEMLSKHNINKVPIIIINDAVVKDPFDIEEIESIIRENVEQ